MDQTRFNFQRIWALDWNRDPDPNHWRTINGFHVHLDKNGNYDGGAGGKFNGQHYYGKSYKQHQKWGHHPWRLRLFDRSRHERCHGSRRDHRLWENSLCERRKNHRQPHNGRRRITGQHHEGPHN